jgi:hypothetical protein
LEKEGKACVSPYRSIKIELRSKNLKFKELMNLVESKLKSKEKLTAAALFLGRYLHFSELGNSYTA